LSAGLTVYLPGTAAAELVPVDEYS
jgi:hypothetical protein